MIVNESLRIEPPVVLSIPLTFTENINIRNINIIKDTPMFINIKEIHHNKEEW
jgi:cytochrome P450